MSTIPEVAGVAAPTVLVSTSDVRAALAQIAEGYPELAKAMQIADAMLVRLETEKDEARLRLGMAYGRAKGGDADGAAEFIESARNSLGKRDGSQPLSI